MAPVSAILLLSVLVLVSPVRAEEASVDSDQVAEDSGSDGSVEELADEFLDCVVSLNREFGACLGDTLEQFRILMKRGNPEPGTPSIDPMTIDSLNFEMAPLSILKMKTTLNKLILEGLGDFKVTQTKADLEGRRIKMKISVPVVKVKGRFNAQCDFPLLSTLKESGPFTSTLKDVRGECDVGFDIVDDPEDAEGRQRIQFKDALFKYTVGEADVDMDFEGTLADFSTPIKAHIKEHGKEIVEKMKPAIRQDLGKIFLHVLNDVFSNIHREDLRSFFEKNHSLDDVDVDNNNYDDDDDDDEGVSS